MSLAAKVVGLLSGIFGITRSGASTVLQPGSGGTVIVRQPGGVVGRNEIQLSAGAAAITLQVPTPSAVTGSSQAGLRVDALSGNAVASTDTNGAAAGGDYNIYCGSAARRVSGNASGGNCVISLGSPIGTGAIGQFSITDAGGTASLYVYPQASPQGTILDFDQFGQGTGLFLKASGGDGNCLDYAMTNAGAWTFSKHVRFIDNLYDIGASGATRPRTAYLGTSVVLPAMSANASGLVKGVAVAPVATTLRARTSNVSTLTTATHNLVAGQIVTVSGMTDTSFNGTFVVATVPSTTTFTYANTAADVVSGADVGGTVTAQAVLQLGAAPATPSTVGVQCGTALEVPAGTAANPALTLGNTVTGFYEGANGDNLMVSSNTSNNVAGFNYLGIQIRNDGAFAFGASTTADLYVVPADSGICRVAAKVTGSCTGQQGTFGWFQDSAGNLGLAANFTSSSATLAVTTFSFPVISGRAYKIEGLIRGNDSTGVDGFKMDFAGGTVTTGTFFVNMESLGLGTVVLGVTSATAMNTALTATTFTNGDLRLTGTYIAAGTGTVIVQMAQVAHTAGTLTILAGSWITLTDLRQV